MKFDDVRLKGFKTFTTINQVKKKLVSKLTKMPCETVKTISALGRVLSKDIISVVDIPHFTRSAMDGYAVKAEDTFGVSQRNPKKFQVIDKIKINEISKKIIQNYEAIQIPTGGAIPEGANAVLKLENVKRIEDQIEVYFPVSPFKNISKIGEDVIKGQKIIEKGAFMRPQEISLLLASNILEIDVNKRPRVALIATGSELLEIGNEPKIGQIIETNTHTLSALCKLYGGIPVRLGIVKDEESAITNIISQALDNDIIVFTGGSSVGERDLIPSIIGNLESSDMLAHGIAMRPGSPTAVAIVHGKPVFCLPGFPVATMTSFEVFVGFTIRKMLGAVELDPRPCINAILTRQIPSHLGRRDFVRVKVKYDTKNAIYQAEPLRTSGSGIISSAVRASGVLEIPEDTEGLDKNTKVAVKLYIPR